MSDQRGLVLLRVADGLIVRLSGTPGRVRAVRVTYPDPSAVAPGDQVTLEGIGGQTRVKDVRRA